MFMCVTIHITIQMSEMLNLYTNAFILNLNIGITYYHPRQGKYIYIYNACINIGWCVYNPKSAYLIVICVYKYTFCFTVFSFSLFTTAAVSSFFVFTSVLILILTSTFFAFDRKLYQHFFKRISSQVLLSPFVCALIFAVETHNFFVWMEKQSTANQSAP